MILKKGQKLTVSRTLKEIEELLEDYQFVRVHHSYLVNLNEVEKYMRGEGGYLIMSDGTTVDVSRSRKETLLKNYNQIDSRFIVTLKVCLIKILKNFFKTSYTANNAEKV